MISTFHPVTDRPLHVDFLRIGEHSSVHVEVPVRFENEEWTTPTLQERRAIVYAAEIEVAALQELMEILESGKV